jgi:hypothetical protein
MAVKNCFIRGSVVRYVRMPTRSVDVNLLEDATRRGERGSFRFRLALTRAGRNGGFVLLPSSGADNTQRPRKGRSRRVGEGIGGRGWPEPRSTREHRDIAVFTCISYTASRQVQCGGDERGHFSPLHACLCRCWSSRPTSSKSVSPSQSPLLRSYPSRHGHLRLTKSQEVDSSLPHNISLGFFLCDYLPGSICCLSLPERDARAHHC